MTEDIIKKMGEDIAPRNMDEFYMGMMLKGILAMMAMDDEDFDPETFDEFLENAAESLGYWMVKYEDEYESIVGKKRQGPNLGEQKVL